MRTRTIVAALLFCIAALPAHAVGRFTDFSDLWWNPGESGWGVNVTHQNELLFLTFFVYGPNRNPVWYSASEVRFAGTGQTDNALVFTGDLFETHGPWLADFFNPATVTIRKVGIVQIRFSSVNTASILYSVDGQTVIKPLTRFTMRVNEFAPTYVGTLIGTYSNCPAAGSNGYREEAGLTMVVTQTATRVTIVSTGVSRTCTAEGVYTQSGRMGSMSGPYRCTDGTQGEFEAFEVEVNPQAFSARFSTRTDRCNFTGRIGGVRRD